jgi:hypothetical protein
LWRTNYSSRFRFGASVNFGFIMWLKPSPWFLILLRWGSRYLVTGREDKSRHFVIMRGVFYQCYNWAGGCIAILSCAFILHPILVQREYTRGWSTWYVLLDG